VEPSVAFIWDAFKGLGALAGLFASGHIFWTWLTKGYPTAIIDLEPIAPGSTVQQHVLRISNHNDRPILIRWQDGESNRLRLAKDNSIHGIVRSLFLGMSIVTVPPQNTRSLLILKPSQYDEMSPDNQLEVVIEWKFVQPIWWQNYRRLRVSIRRQDFEHLLSGDAIEND
jgi:hypothetical protein